MTIRTRHLSAPLLFIATAACVGDFTPRGLQETTTVDVTSDGGGSYVGSQDKIAFEIAPGSVPSNVTITASVSTNAPAPPNTTVVGPTYVMGPEGQSFSTPATLDLPFDSSKIPAGKTAADIVVYTAPLGSTAFTELHGSVLYANHIRVQTHHFSVFLPAVP
jgi:hypothetical protein